MRDVVGKGRVLVFPETNALNNVVEGMVSVTQANGRAELSSTTALLGSPASRALRQDFLTMICMLEWLTGQFPAVCSVKNSWVLVGELLELTEDDDVRLP